MSSPPSGRSTLITSAPRSPSSIVANGPASTREKSATRIPSSGGIGCHPSQVRTLVVSDLHLGSGAARGPAAPARAARAAARGAARGGPAGDPRRRRRAARPAQARHRRAGGARVFADLGEALGPDGELVMTAGNHDHGLVAGWIDGAPGDRAVRLPRARAAPRAGARPARSPRRSPATPRPRACGSPTRASGCATTSTRSTATTPTCTRPCRRSSGSRPARWRAGSCGCPRTARRPTTTRRCSRRCTRG